MARQPKRGRRKAATEPETVVDTSAGPGIGPVDLHLFHEGTHDRAYEQLGAHLEERDGTAGARFALWAPNAASVHVIGDFNGWTPDATPMERVPDSGIWQTFVPGIQRGARYKYRIESRFHGYRIDKADPYARFAERPPHTASVVWDDDHAWSDAAWMEARTKRDFRREPMSIYEMHLGSWSWPDGDATRVGYREIADRLVPYLLELGFTHVEFTPLTEFPYDPSWGYQVTGYFAPTSRFGRPEDLKYLIDRLHQAGIGVILDWVPSHFPLDAHGLAFFDGTWLYEHADPRQGFHPDWKTAIFNFGRPEVRSFLISSARFWIEQFHIDGLRVDAVASMLYLDYSREAGEWVANVHGGHENLEAIAFLRQFNRMVGEQFPGVVTIAEESTAWPMVSRPPHDGGLGFHMKWDMGWMHDTLRYFDRDPVHRRFHHGDLTFRGLYAWNENYVLPLSHDEFVHGKASLLHKMAGDDPHKFANLRLLLALMYATPGKKLLFMGAEIAQRIEWNFAGQLQWELLEYPTHDGVRRLVAELNALYRRLPALHDCEFEPAGFDWLDVENVDQSVVVTLRRSHDGSALLVMAANCTPMPRDNYRIGVPRGGTWTEVLTTDAPWFGGNGYSNDGGVEAVEEPWRNQPFSITVTLPPLGVTWLVADQVASD